jgi:hypothetical protein
MLLNRIRAKADERPPTTDQETDHAAERRDANGHFEKGTRLALDVRREAEVGQ